MENLSRFLKFPWGIKNKKLKVANYCLAALLTGYLFVVIFPEPFFNYTFSYKSFVVHTNKKAGEDLLKILDVAQSKLVASEIYDSSLVHHIYLCDHFQLYSFFAPFARKAFACNYPLINNIFVSRSDIEKNECYKNDFTDAYTRKLSVVLAHEVTHTLIEKKIGFWKFKTLPSWKNEGYCDFVGNGPQLDTAELKTVLKKNLLDEGPGATYRKYYLAVNYLITHNNLAFSDLVNGNQLFEEVLHQLEDKKN
jgi:hypothetical protein